MHAMEPDVNNRYATADEMLMDLEEFRKNPATNFSYISNDNLALTRERTLQATREVPTGTILKADSILPKPVRTPPRNNDLTREEYRRVNRRATRTSALVGVFLIIIFLVAVSIFIWKNFLNDIFNPQEESVTIPKFVGQNYSDIMENTDYTQLYDFTVTEEYSNDVNEGVVISQSPAPDRTQKLPASGIIDVNLTVSKGEEPVQTMPNLVNMDYRQAVILLDNMKLKLNIVKTDEYNDDYTKDYVISTLPQAGEPLVEGGTVYITYSNGPEIQKTTVPMVEGSSLTAAENRLKGYNLAWEVEYVEDEEIPENRVISQDIMAGEEVPINTVIHLVVSSGPASRRRRARIRRRRRARILRRRSSRRRGGVVVAAAAAEPLMKTGVIFKAISGFYTVETGTGTIECKARGRFRRDKITPLVGDTAEITVTDDGRGYWRRSNQGKTPLYGRPSPIWTSLSSLHRPPYP
jgi:serine/threonine-protein kinase